MKNHQRKNGLVCTGSIHLRRLYLRVFQIEGMGVVFETIRNYQPLLWAQEKKWTSSLSNIAAMENEQKLILKLSASWDATPFSSFKDSVYLQSFHNLIGKMVKIVAELPELCSYQRIHQWISLGKNNGLAIRHTVDVVELHPVLVPLPLLTAISILLPDFSRSWK